MMLPYHHSKSVLVFDKSLFNKCQLSRVSNWSILPYLKRTKLRYSSLSILCCSLIRIKVIFLISDLCWFLIQTFIMQTPDTHTHMTHTYTHTQVVITHKHPHYIHTHTHTPWWLGEGNDWESPWRNHRCEALKSKKCYSQSEKMW